MGPTTAVDLLEHRMFVRAVVRGLLDDEHAVDDVVQETCLRALERPPREPRGWFARVASIAAVGTVTWRSAAPQERAAPSRGPCPTASRVVVSAPMVASAMCLP